MKPTKPLAKRLTKRTLAQLQARKITNAQAAEQLGVSETYLSRTVAALQDKVPGTSMQKRSAAAKLYKTRQEQRDILAKRVNKGKLTIAAAAEQAGCSERTMFRYVAKYRPTE
jgi:AraC-like DNA-binding protein